MLKKVLDAYLLDFLDESIGRMRKKTFIFLHKIQFIPYWSEIVKRYLDRDLAINFVVSGSSSLLLESESSESLAGRLDMLRLPPPDFRDYMTINRLEPPPEFKINPGLAKIPNDFVIYYGKNQARLAREYLDYLRWGGFPQLKDIITRSRRKTGRTGEKVCLSTPTLAAYQYGHLSNFPEILGRLIENDVYLRLRERDDGLSFWRVGRQEIDFMFHVQDVVFPVECKTGRLRSKDIKLIRTLAEKLGTPFSIMVTYDTIDFSDHSILKIPAFLL